MVNGEFVKRETSIVNRQSSIVQCGGAVLVIAHSLSILLSGLFCHSTAFVCRSTALFVIPTQEGSQLCYTCDFATLRCFAALSMTKANP
jgi:hypothetical protein